MSESEAQPVRIGQKTLDILTMSALPRASKLTRDAMYHEMCDKYANKAVRVKVAELAERGYLMWPGTADTIDQSWLTDKGRHALESNVIIE